MSVDLNHSNSTQHISKAETTRQNNNLIKLKKLYIYASQLYIYGLMLWPDNDIDRPPLSTLLNLTVLNSAKHC